MTFPRARSGASATAALLAVCAASVAASCGSSDGAAAPPENHAPVWSDAPDAAIAIGQGQGASLRLTVADPDGNPTSATLGTAALGADVTAALDADAGVVALHAGYGASGRTQLEVAIADDQGASTTVTVHVDERPMRWLGEQKWTAKDGPAAREHAALLVDADRRRVFLLSGSGYAPQGTPLDDLWKYDLDTSTWSVATPSGDAPTPAGSRRVAQIPGKAVAYLFGGYGVNNATDNDLYRASFDGDSVVFQAIAQTNPPPSRSLHMFAYDSVTDRFFAFGGVGTKVYGDTWTMKLEGDHAVWEKLSPAASPSPRYGFFYGVDDANGRVLLFSGAQGIATIHAATDTWALDMRSDPPAWQLVAEGSADVPTGRRNGCAVFDPRGPRLLVFGGTADAMKTEPGLYMLDARPGQERWSALTLDAGPPLRSSGFGFQDAASNRIVLGFGNDAGLYRDWWSLGY